MYFPGKIRHDKIRDRHYLLVLFVFLSLTFSIPGFSGSVAPAYSQQIIPGYGGGSTEIRLYSDYFCSACKRIEPEIESLLKKLVIKNRLRITYIDAPFHRETSLYVRYFLYYATGNETFVDTLRFRKLLFDAAAQNTRTEESLRDFLRKRGALPEARDVSLSFRIMNDYLKEDRIRNTPTIVIIQDGHKKVYTGTSEIPAALQDYARAQGILIKKKEIEHQH